MMLFDLKLTLNKENGYSERREGSSLGNNGLREMRVFLR